jgi:1-acyl-sn-glycerol-3-phosphate acyltransferase
MEPVYTPVVGLALTVFRTMKWDLRFTGTEHVPEQGAAVIATNHIGYLDFVFVGAAARERGRLVRFMAKKEVFDNRISGPLMRGMKHIPADRFGSSGTAIELSLEALRRGEVVGMFPEATISRSFVPKEAKTGAARLAMEAGCPLIPGAVWGSQRIMTKGRPRNFQRGVVITVDVGEPIRYEPDDDPGVVTKLMMDRIADLVTAAQRSYPQEPAGDDDRWWLPAHLGGSAPTVAEAVAMAEVERAERQARHDRQAREDG